jgi:predicted MFS family arabinose efflux permease
MITTETKRGIFALMVAHCAGMMDLVALPLWVGTLVSKYQFDPQQAGGLVTLFLIGASIASAFLAPRVSSHNAKWMAVGGFGVALVAFMISSTTVLFPLLAVLHFVGGIAAGTALSFTHSTIGRAANPHRLFAFVSLAIGIFGVVLLGSVPGIVDKNGGPSLFYAFSVVMGVATLAALLFFPTPTRSLNLDHAAGTSKLPPLGRAVWCSIFAISLMCMVQSMTLSFFERVGMARGFGLELVTMALIIYGFVTVLPGPLAAILQKRVAATTVVCTMPVLQAVFAMIITHTSTYALYAASGAMMAFTIIFTHTFAFGLLARLDPSGRATAGTPAMLMVGSALSPFIGGTLVKFIGFEAIGYAAIVLVALELVLFNTTRRIVVAADANDLTVANALG